MLVGVFNPIQNGGGGGGGGGGWRNGGQGEKRGPPTSFSPVTSRKVGTSPQNFLTFSFNLLATLM